MHPASGDPQVFFFFCQSVINLISVCHTNACVILQKFPRMRSITCFLIFIQNDLLICIHKTGSINPHPAFASGRTPIFVDKDRCLICLDHMILIKQLMEIVIHDSQITFAKTDHPVCHVLTRNGKAVTFKLFFQTVKRNCIHIFTIDNSGRQGWRDKTSVKQILRMGCLNHMFIIFTGINTYVMFLHFNFCRYKMITSGSCFQPFSPNSAVNSVSVM